MLIKKIKLLYTLIKMQNIVNPRLSEETIQLMINFLISNPTQDFINTDESERPRMYGKNIKVTRSKMAKYLQTQGITSDFVQDSNEEMWETVSSKKALKNSRRVRS